MYLVFTADRYNEDTSGGSDQDIEHTPAITAVVGDLHTALKTGEGPTI